MQALFKAINCELQLKLVFATIITVVNPFSYVYHDLKRKLGKVDHSKLESSWLFKFVTCTNLSKLQQNHSFIDGVNQSACVVRIYVHITSRKKHFLTSSFH